jgi:hypothetical protein
MMCPIAYCVVMRAHAELVQTLRRSVLGNGSVRAVCTYSIVRASAFDVAAVVRLHIRACVLLQQSVSRQIRACSNVRL